MTRIVLGFAIALCISPSLKASSHIAAGPFELQGKILVEGGRPPLVRVALLTTGTPFAVSSKLAGSGEFRFRSLAAGDYVVAVMRPGLGEIRRSVVISPALADDDGIVRTSIRYSPGEAAMNPALASVSLAQLSVPGEAFSKYRDAREQAAGGDLSAAAAKLQEAVEIAPKFSAAWTALGIIAQSQGDDSLAERYFRRALEAEPGSFEASLNLGSLLLRSGHAREALAYHRRALNQRPNDAQANAQLGMNYFVLGQFMAAETYLLEAKSIDPEHFSEPQLFLAGIYAQRGDRQATLAELKDLVAHRPDDPLSRRLRKTIATLEAAGAR